jgi:hypothetical protein
MPRGVPRPSDRQSGITAPTRNESSDVSDQVVFGVTTLWKAILADTGETVLVTANALRLLRFGSGRLASKRIG